MLLVWFPLPLSSAFPSDYFILRLVPCVASSSVPPQFLRKERMQLLANILQKPQEGLSLVQLVPVLIPPSDTVYECVGVVLMGGVLTLGVS